MILITYDYYLLIREDTHQATMQVPIIALFVVSATAAVNPDIERLISYHNSRDGALYKLELNHFAELTKEQLRGLLKPYAVQESGVRRKEVAAWKPIPQSYDWRSKGYVTPAHLNLPTDSGAVVAVVGAVETFHAIRTNKLTQLSTQQVRDCGPLFTSSPQQLMWYVTDAGGLETYADYPDKVPSFCHANETKIAAKVDGYEMLHPLEEQVMQEVANTGTFAVSLHMPTDMLFYKSGVYNHKSCPARQPNHSMLLVGYGTDNGTDYWLLRNNWGRSWGEDGYIRIARAGNLCGVMDEPLCPLYFG